MTTPAFTTSADGMSVIYNGSQYFLPGNTWSVNTDGSVTFNGSVWFPAGTNTASGAGIVVFGPGGGTATFPAVEPGPVGPAPRFVFEMIQLAYGTPLPAVNPVVTPTEYDSYGNPVVSNVTFYVNSGAAGQNGTTDILTAGDLEGNPQAGYFIGYDSTGLKAQWQPAPIGNWYYASGIGATASNTTTQKQIASIAVPGRPWAWWPHVSAQANVVGASDTRVDLVARVGSSTGQICAYGYGNPGATPGTVSTSTYQLGPGSANIVPANTPTVIYLFAENQTSSPNAWSTTSSCLFSVKTDYALS